MKQPADLSEQSAQRVDRSGDAPDEPTALPILGMKLTPAYWGSDPLMMGAYMSHLTYCVGKPEIKARFKAETGMDLDRVLMARGLEQMVDKATGHDRATVAAFADWVTEWLWGIDGVEPTEEQQDGAGDTRGTV